MPARRFRSRCRSTSRSPSAPTGSSARSRPARYARDAIVVDLGTATTFDCITKDAVFLGGVIAPGVHQLGRDAVPSHVQAARDRLGRAGRVIGTRTEECIRAGVMFGAAAESIDGVVGRIKAEWPNDEVPIVIGTGGLAETFSPLCRSFDAVDPYLTLYGLSLAFELLGPRGSARRRDPQMFVPKHFTAERTALGPLLHARSALAKIRAVSTLRLRVLIVQTTKVHRFTEMEAHHLWPPRAPLA